MSYRLQAIDDIDEHIATAQSVKALVDLYLDPAVDLLVNAIKNDHKILTCGNGGSAAEAQHLAAELSVRFVNDRRAFPALALCADSAALTACGNDYGYKRVFQRQVEALGRSGDVLVAFSTSGKSDNVLEAIHAARRAGMNVLGLSGRKGMLAECDIDLVIPSLSTARIQEMHLILVHLLMEGIERSLK